MSEAEAKRFRPPSETLTMQHSHALCETATKKNQRQNRTVTDLRGLEWPQTSWKGTVNIIKCLAVSNPGPTQGHHSNINHRKTETTLLGPWVTT